MNITFTFIHANNIIESFINDDLRTFVIGDVYISNMDTAYYITDIKKVIDSRFNKVTVLLILEEVPDDDVIVEILMSI